MRQILLLVTLVFLMSGCMKGDSYSFSGSGDNWDILYEVVVTNEVKQQTSGKIKYIGDNKAPETIEYKIEYNNKGQGSSGEESPLKYGVVKFKNLTCGNCEIIQKDDEIEVEIMWEGQTEKLILTTDNGTIDFVWWQPNHKIAEIGYVISKDYWGKGFTTELAKEIIKFGFEEMDLVRIQARCDVENIGSARVMEKAGMSFEGIIRKGIFVKGKHRDLKMYSILKEEF